MAETFCASADAYNRHVGRYSAQLASALIDFAGVEPGMQVLDVGWRTRQANEERGQGELAAPLRDKQRRGSVKPA